MDTFFKNEALLNKLKSVYKRYGCIIIAYDYDDTVAPTYMAKNCEMVCDLLRRCRAFADFVCFTSNVDTQKVLEYLRKEDIPCDKINENVDRVRAVYGSGYGTKVYYNILLDDKSGLGQAYEILRTFADFILPTTAAASAP